MVVPTELLKKNLLARNSLSETRNLLRGLTPDLSVRPSPSAGRLGSSEDDCLRDSSSRRRHRTLTLGRIGHRSTVTPQSLNSKVAPCPTGTRSATGDTRSTTGVKTDDHLHPNLVLQNPNTHRILWFGADLSSKIANEEQTESTRRKTRHERSTPATPKKSRDQESHPSR